MYMRLWTQVNPLAEFIKYNNIVLGWMLNKLTDEINPELWIYKWVIITPSKYFENDVNEKINEILQK
jgi:hypothetical protein